MPGTARVGAVSGHCGPALSKDDLLRQLEEAKRQYWSLVRRYAEALGGSESLVLEGQAQFVDEAGNVWVRDEFAGHTRPPASHGAAWGLEAAGPPWSPPTDWIHENFGPGRVEKDRAYRERLQGIGQAPADESCTADVPAALPGGSPAAPLSVRQFAAITADPPWQYDNRASRGAAENHYPVMSTEELGGLLDRLGRDGSCQLAWCTARRPPGGEVRTGVSGAEGQKGGSSL